MRDNMSHDSYIGDGVYASWDGYGIMLDLRAQDSTTRIYLEPIVFRNLNKYYAEMVALAEKEASELSKLRR